MTRRRFGELNDLDLFIIPAATVAIFGAELVMGVITEANVASSRQPTIPSVRITLSLSTEGHSVGVQVGHAIYGAGALGLYSWSLALATASPCSCLKVRHS